MRCRGLAIALVSACGFSHGVIGDQQDASTIDAPMIDAPMTDTLTMMIDAMIDAPPAATDTDMDGVVDSADNCPTVANTNQRNHDGDARGDVCDGCPHLASATDPDGDLDGVGDACDPRPSQSGDQRVLFEGFYDANATAGWATSGNGTWSISNGALVQSSTSQGASSIGPTMSIARTAVTAGVRVTGFGAGTGFETPSVSVVAGVTGSNQAYYCSGSQPNDPQIYATAFWSGLGGFSQDNTDWGGTFAMNSELRLTETLVGTTETCTAVEGTTATATASTNTGPISGAARVSTTTASASFDYLFVVSIGN